jgi:hypothetical protein
MPAKRKITINRKVKNVEKTPEIEEKPVSFVEENKISDAEISSGATVHKEQEIGLKKLTK